MQHNLESISRNFQILGDFIRARPFGNGHIHDTYIAEYNQGGTPVRYIHQRINHNIFRDPPQLMYNIQKVTEHIRKKMVALNISQSSSKTLTLIHSCAGLPYFEDRKGNFWRTYIFIEKGTSYDSVTGPGHVYEAAKAFGTFQLMLSDLSISQLATVIPDFHNTPKRFSSLQQAVEADSYNRVHHARPEIEFAIQQQDMCSIVVDLQKNKELPERIAHNDTKINNVIIDDSSGQGKCVIDLDTVMAGSILYDFGDMVRTATCLAPEDEVNLDKVHVELPLFEALVRGYLNATNGFLQQSEKQHLVLSGKLIAFETGIRFLTDYLQGDTYFKVYRTNHNLDRCRAQFKLVQSIIEQEHLMDKLVAKF